MPASPEARAFATFLDRATVRARVHGALRGLAAGVGVAIVPVLAGAFRGAPGTRIAVTAALAALGAAFGAVMARRRVVVELERRTPASRNLIFTAAELIDGPDAAPEHVSARIWADAARLTNALDPRRLWPLARLIAAASGAGLLWAALAALLPQGVAAIVPGGTAAPAIHGLVADIEAPAYMRRAPVRLENPARIETMAGSRLHLSIETAATTLDVETINGTRSIEPDPAGRFVIDVVADADGFLAFVPRSSSGEAGTRRLVGLSVTPDRAPRVAITDPGHDLLLPDGRATLPLAVAAEDDFGLDALGVRYTKVSGSGENFTFTEGDVAVTITRSSETAWTAGAKWSLAGLGLEPGDMVIYRGVARDARPGAPTAESDSLIVEIAAPGALPGEGFAIDDRLDKYAISQQMVIVNTERLLARRTSMAIEDFRREAEGVAAEQRQVRAEFVFMMGGELVDMGLDATTLNEEAEAAGEGDLAAGRLVNQGRADLLRAIRSMSQAASKLVEPDLAGALPIERDALTYLQRAFSRSRYILRTLSERERLDLSRRLTGVLAALDRRGRPAAEAAPSSRLDQLRRALADFASIAAEPDARLSDRCTALAQRVLRIDPAAQGIVSAADAVTAVARAAGTNDTRGLAAAIDAAAGALATLVRSELPRDPGVQAPLDLKRLAGALADAQRKGGRP